MRTEVDLSCLLNLTNTDLIKMSRDYGQNVFIVKRRILQLLRDFPPPTSGRPTTLST